jgi:hypothetical protein
MNNDAYPRLRAAFEIATTALDPMEAILCLIETTQDVRVMGVDC